MEKFKAFLTGTAVLVLLVFSATAQQSVLSSGDWYKMSTEAYGIYKISYNDLQSWGIDPSAINPKHIGIYGNGNGMLSEDPEAFRYDDLQEIAIEVAGEDDGVFDPGDYILFYGEGPTKWNLNEETNLFGHEINLYTDQVVYFLHFGNSPGKRIPVHYSTTFPSTWISTAFDDYQAHELDLHNFIHSGKQWYGEKFDNTLSYEYDISIPNLKTADTIQLTFSAAARASSISTMDVFVNNSFIGGMTMQAVTFTPSLIFARKSSNHFGFLSNNPAFSLKFTYEKPNDSAMAWMDHFTLNYRRNLTFGNEALIFRDLESVGAGMITTFEINAPTDDLYLWNITDPLSPAYVDFDYTGATASFTLETDELLEFIAFNDQLYLTPAFEAMVPNQNLHALSPPDLLIITAEEFMTQAEQLAVFRETNDGLSTLVVTPQLIYNEFSSGVQDVSAIRDFAKYLYEKDTATGLQYLLLFGKASYDYKNITANNTNFVPVWETEESLNAAQSYCSDDFFITFNNNYLSGSIAIGAGRIPVVNSADAASVVQKIINYTTDPAFADSWRNGFALIADDEDNNLHLTMAEQLGAMTDTINPAMNISKVYLDAFEQEINMNGDPVYPAANEAIIQKINEGVLLLGYFGHGGSNTLAAENVFSVEAIEDLENNNNLPLMLNASGDINRFDDPDIISLGEQLLLSDEKGMIGVYSPSRLSYANANFNIIHTTLEQLISYKQNRLGKIIKDAKNSIIGNTIQKRYVYFGDPATHLAIPQYNVHTLTINGIPTEAFNDTISPGEQIEITGVIEDDNGNTMNGFNGEITTTVFDMAEIKSTLGNDPGSAPDYFSVQENILTEINTSVTAGTFEATVNLPQISTEAFGNLKISYYAQDGLTDAQGQYSGVISGGPMNGIGDRELLSAIRVYPNPVRDRLTLETGKEFDGLAYEILTPTGLLLHSGEAQKVNAGYHEVIDVSAYQKGMYLLKITTGYHVACWKIIRQ